MQRFRPLHALIERLSQLTWKPVLSTKLLAAHLLTLVAVGALWVVGGAYALGQMNRANDARFAASRLRQRVIEARLAAQTFLSRDVQDARFFVGLPLPAMEDFSRAMSEAEDRIQMLERLRPADTASIQRLRALVDEYQTTFLRITELYRRQGYADWGLEGEWQKALVDTEAAVAGHPDLQIALLEIRKDEKEYLLRRDPAIREPVMQAVARLREARLAPAASTRLKQSLDRYARAFDEYAALDREIGVGGDAGLNAAMAAAAREMEPIVRGIHEDSIRTAARARRALWSVGAAVLVAGLLLGAAVSYVFARSISRPLEELQSAAQAIGQGQLDVQVMTAGADEVGDLGRALAGMASSLQRSWQNVRETNELLSAILDGTPDAVFVKDAGGHYVLANAACARFLGRPVEEVLGRTNEDLVGSEIARLVDARDRDVLASGQTRTYEVIDEKAGRAFLTTKGVLRDAAGQVKGLFGISREITEHKQAEFEMKAAREAAEQASRAKSDFLANMSHEIRTPMNAVLGMTQLLLESEMRPEQREYALTVRESAEALLSILDEILDFSRVEAGRVELREEPFDLEDVVAGAVRTLALRAQEKKLELAFRVDPGVPRTLVGDAGRFRQVLVNLVANAVKFTEQGEVLVSADAFDLGRGKTLLRVLVADTGMGVPPDVREKIFEPFVQADSSTRRRFGGTGLGLAISARLAALMGGRIDVDEAPGGGSIFTFTARLRAAEAAPRVAQVPELAGLHALVVDDNATARKIVLERLASWGLRGTGAGTAEAALAALKRAQSSGDPIAMAVVDADVGGNGFELGARLAHEGGLRGPVVYMLSPDGGGPLARAAAPTWSLMKPIQPSNLLEVVQRALGRPGGTQREREQAALSRPAGARHLRVLVAEDNPVNQRLILRLLERRGHSAFLVANGIAARDAFVAQGPFDAVLMDVQMPEMDGLQATAAIRALEAVDGLRTPIIALTAHALREDRERCLAAGMDAYLAKPIRFQELFSALEGSVDQAQAARAAAVPSPPPVPSAPVTPAAPVSAPPSAPAAAAVAPAPAGAPVAVAEPIFDEARALDQAAQGDRELLRELARLFVSEAPKTLLQARSALQAGDLSRVVSMAHTLKGSTSHFYAAAATESLSRLEDAARSGTHDVPLAVEAAEREVARLCRALEALA